jgi:ABC-type transport system involved in cytochrome c biogenesis permease subunit
LAELSRRRSFRVPLDRLSARYGSFLAPREPRIALTGEGEMPPASVLLRHGFRHPAPLGPQSTQPATAPATRPAGYSDKLRSWALDAEPMLAFSEALRRLSLSWRARDAEAVNRLVGLLAELQERFAPQRVPSSGRISLERVYNRTYHSTIVWIGFLAAFLVLLYAAPAGCFAWGRRIGLAILLLSTLALWAGFAARWVLSGRAWYLPPIMTQFGSVMGSALLAATASLVLERFWKVNWLALAAAFYATVALMLGFWMPQAMGADMSALPGLLSSRIMAVHVAFIIFGHALVGMGAFISVAYLLARALRRSATPAAPADLCGRATDGLPATLDRCNLVVMQLACWTVVLGTILGAVWGDFAWGRWWGWDRKETWALITAAILILTLHLRFVTGRRRGVVTAVGAILATAAMLVNWIVINYLMPSLHSYA